MFSKSAIRRLNFALTILCFCCVIPFDWNSRKRELKPTKSKFKEYLNSFFLFLFAMAVIYFGVCFTVDLFVFKELEFNQLFVLGVYLSYCFLYLCMGIMLKVSCRELTYILNNVFYLDKYFQRKFLAYINYCTIL